MVIRDRRGRGVHTVIPALGRQKPGDCSQFEGSLVHTGRPFVKERGVFGGRAGRGKGRKKGGKEVEGEYRLRIKRNGIHGHNFPALLP